MVACGVKFAGIFVFTCWNDYFYVLRTKFYELRLLLCELGIVLPEFLIYLHSGTTVKQFRTTDMEQEVLDNLNTLIVKGHTDLYPLKALLWASNNWYTKRIVRAGMYTDILQEGIEKDALGPQNEAAWWWVKKALDANDYEYRLLGDVDIIAPLIQNASDAHNWWAEKIRKKIMES